MTKYIEISIALLNVCSFNIDLKVAFLFQKSEVICHAIKIFMFNAIFKRWKQ